MSIVYQDAFGGATIYPSDISYRAVTLSANTTLSWPEETSTSGDKVARIMDVTASSAGLAFTMPPATEASTGETVLWNNVGANSFSVKNNSGTQIVTVGAGEAWQIYLSVNTTAAGSWRSFEYGAGVSSAEAASLAGTGIIAVGTLLSQSVPVSTFNSNYTASINDRAKMYVWTGAAGTLTLDAAGTLGDNWFMYVRNGGTGALTTDTTGTPTIDGAATLVFQPGESAIIATDGSNFYSIGFGQSATFAFDYTSIAVAGTGDYTLSGTELNRIAYNFTGLLTGNRNVIVPATVQQYWISNATTGAFTLTVKTAAGTGQTINSGQRAIFYCDGTNVVDADTSTVSTPISIANGGTGAVTASSARTNLGATSVGDALFIAVSQAAAYSALGVAPSGVVDGGAF